MTEIFKNLNTLTFRDLRADEIECRIGSVRDNGVALLLYKDARCDMNILDETVGALNWERAHSRENANCTVSIYDPIKEEWISKEDTGTESNTEAEKGLASDSFKRACFNWGIGRELYTAPRIFIKGAGKYDRFYVKSIEITNKKITGLVICGCDQYGRKTDTVAFAMETPPAYPPFEEMKIAVASDYDVERLGKLLKWAGANSLDDLTQEQMIVAFNKIRGKEGENT